jgi:hypothetical protein
VTDSYNFGRRTSGIRGGCTTDRFVGEKAEILTTSFVFLDSLIARILQALDDAPLGFV